MRLCATSLYNTTGSVLVQTLIHPWGNLLSQKPFSSRIHDKFSLSCLSLTHSYFYQNKLQTNFPHNDDQLKLFGFVTLSTSPLIERQTAVDKTHKSAQYVCAISPSHLTSPGSLYFASIIATMRTIFAKSNTELRSRLGPHHGTNFTMTYRDKLASDQYFFLETSYAYTRRARGERMFPMINWQSCFTIFISLFCSPSISPPPCVWILSLSLFLYFVEPHCVPVVMNQSLFPLPCGIFRLCRFC